MKYKNIKWLMFQRPKNPANKKRWYGMYKWPDTSKYMPHQSEQECARRLRKCAVQS